ncbi:cytochrome c oxidase assembly protein [Exiguobacterium flavidum]|uniref:cytochrome c oxidase assembly protein n=1 Tax=Exiguobacterium flavidum TaxID=2184695 RepID=UPI000DF74418|nr:cytochrome c oxidase assembly protein [Exiguobacterium flavidum]
MLGDLQGVLSQFDWYVLWSPYYALMLVAIYVGYAVYTEKFKPIGEETTLFQKFSMLASLIVYYIGFGSPLDVLAHITFSAHMLQMVFVYMVAPPLAMLAIPGWVFERLFRVPVFGKLLGFFVSPLIALVLFNSIFTFYHMPFIFDYVLTNYGVHRAFHGALILLSMTMWYPVIAPVDEKDSLSDLKKMVYIVANGVLLTPACAFMIFSQSFQYEAYMNPAMFAKVLGYCMPNNDVSGLDISRILGTTPDLLEDQRFGGVLMKLGQEIVYGLFFGLTFFKWVKRTKSSAIDEGMSFSPKEN